MKKANEFALYFWFLCSILLRFWDHLFLEVLALLACLDYYITLVLLVYFTWRTTKSFKQSIKSNLQPVILGALPFIFALVFHILEIFIK